MLRLLLIMILTLSIPAFGQAAASVSEQCRVMPDALMTPTPAVVNKQACDVAGMDKHAKPGSSKTCSQVQDCLFGGALYLSNSSLSVHASPPVRVVTVLPDTPVVFHTPDGLWRPPRLS